MPKRVPPLFRANDFLVDTGRHRTDRPIGRAVCVGAGTGDDSARHPTQLPRLDPLALEKGKSSGRAGTHPLAAEPASLVFGAGRAHSRVDRRAVAVLHTAINSAIAGE